MATVHTFHTPHAIVYLQGRQPRIGDEPALSKQFAQVRGANRNLIAQLIVARDHNSLGFKGVYPPAFDRLNYQDGAVIKTAGSAVILQTADCPTVILSHRRKAQVAVFHAGRPALTPDPRCPSCTVIENVVQRLGVITKEDAVHLEALVIGDICGQHFKHDALGAEALIAPFRRFPETVFTDSATGSLSLYEVIKHELMSRGVPEGHIRRDGPCPYEDEGLASYRRNKTELRNTITVILTS